MAVSLPVQLQQDLGETCGGVGAAASGLGRVYKYKMYNARKVQTRTREPSLQCVLDQDERARSPLLHATNEVWAKLPAPKEEG
jgi:hypothetical protein